MLCCCVVTDGSYTCKEHRATDRDVESLRRTPDTRVTLCVNYNHIKKLKLLSQNIGHFSRLLKHIAKEPTSKVVSLISLPAACVRQCGGRGKVSDFGKNSIIHWKLSI